MKLSIDIQILLNLSNGDREFVKDVLTLVIERVPIEADQIKKYQEQGNIAELSLILHKVRSFTSPLGVPSLGDKLSRLEKVVKTHELASLQVEIHQILELLDHLKLNAEKQLDELIKNK